MEEIAAQLTEPFIKISEEIAFNGTLAIQLVVFLALYYILKPLLWKPFLATIDERKALTTGNQEKAAEEEAEVLRMQEQYEASLRDARQAASAERQKTRAEAQKAEKEVLDAARAEAVGITTKVRGEVEQATAKARESLKSQADDIANAMTDKILGRTA